MGHFLLSDRFVPSDGGMEKFEKFGFSEDNDCVVRALAHATSLPYGRVRAIAAFHGRVSKKGMDSPEFYTMMDRHFPRQTFLYARSQRAKVHYITVNRFINEFPPLTYVFCMSDHVSCAIEGRVYDNLIVPKVWRIHAIWRIEKKGIKSFNSVSWG